MTSKLVVVNSALLNVASMFLFHYMSLLYTKRYKHSQQSHIPCPSDVVQTTCSCVICRYLTGKPVKGYAEVSVSRPWFYGFHDPKAIRMSTMVMELGILSLVSVFIQEINFLLLRVCFIVHVLVGSLSRNRYNCFVNMLKLYWQGRHKTNIVV